MPRLWHLLLLSALTCVSRPPQPNKELELLIQVRQRMSDDLARLQDYTCLETVERSVRRTSDRTLLYSDRLRVEVAFIGDKEMFAWPGAGKFEYSSLEAIAPGGASGFGSFGGWAHSVFRSSGPVFEPAGERGLAGRRAIQFNFRVPLLNSAYRIDVRGVGAAVPYSGLVWIDPEALDVMRLEIRADPSGLPVASVTNVIDYARTPIGPDDFLLPQSSELTMVDLNGEEHRNVHRLSGCRRYTAESSVSFVAPPAAGPAPREQAEELRLPAGIVLDVKLQSPVSFEHSAAGDEITARLERDVKASGLLLPKGAVCTGRLRRLEQIHQPEKYFIVGIELSSVAFGEKRAAFQARLTGPRLQVRERRESAFYGKPPDSRGFEMTGLDIDDSDPSSPAGVFRVWCRSLRLNRGLRMTWETSDGETKPPPRQ